jgi:hypothetical protein
MFSVPPDAPAGVYPLLVTAANGSDTVSAGIVLLVDADAPTASVDSVRFALGGEMLADGRVPLSASWTSADATSGVATGAVSVDGTSFATGSAGTAALTTADGAHDLTATVADAAGNTSAPATLSFTQSSAQESGAAYTGAWSTSTSASPWGTTRYSKAKGAQATYAFSGTDIAWVSAKGPKRGKAKVYLDGVLVAKVDLLANQLLPSRIVFAASGLAADLHTLKIVVNGTSGRPRVDVDGFVVLNP